MTQDDLENRYRRATEAALEQLGWCINYLQAIRQRDLARQLSRNRDGIRRRLRKAAADR